MSVGAPRGPIPSQDRYRIEYHDRPLSQPWLDELLEHLYDALLATRGRYYARWAVSRWRDQLGEQGMWLARSAERGVGLVSVRLASERKGEMTHLYALEPGAGPALVRAAFDGFRAQGADLVATSFQSWDHALDRRPEEISRALDELEFRAFGVCVLEADPQASRARPIPVLPEGFSIRGLAAVDIPACADIMHRSPDLLMDEVRYPPDECERILRRTTGPSGRFAPDLAGAVLDESGALGGFTTANTTGVIGQVYVLREHRRRGVGRALVDRALRGLADRGVERAILTAIAGNQAAFALYSRLGFRESYRYPLRYWKDRRSR